MTKLEARITRDLDDASPDVPAMISLFSGAGGLDLGLEQAGFRTVLANEVEPYACETLRLNRFLRSIQEHEFEPWFSRVVLSQKCHKHLQSLEVDKLRRRLITSLREKESYLGDADIVERDVRQLSSEEVLSRVGMKRGQLDLMAGGAPCQPFSRAGKRELVDCDAGQLFMEFVRLVDGIRPRWIVFENVKGLVIHKADVASLRCSLCGNVSLSKFDERDKLKQDASVHQFCDSCGHFSDQCVTWENRRAGSLEIIENEFRLLGYSCVSRVLNAADYGVPQIRERLFIIGSRDGEQIRWPEPTHSDAVEVANPPLTLFPNPAPAMPWHTLGSELYSAGHWRYGMLDQSRAVLWVKNVVRPHDEPVTWSLTRPAPTIGAHQSAKLAIAPYGVPENQLARQQWHVLGRRQGDTAPVFVEHEYLTDEELLALQTFPAGWYLHGTRMQRAFQIGNAVPPHLARCVGSVIAQAMNLAYPVAHLKEDDNAGRYAACV